ncbi:MAG: hypothetical protein HOP18_05635 [Deltaproteobacteria bacterium]|nr:hypothetical protein [Deltaproteobacteria bacterium]
MQPAIVDLAERVTVLEKELRKVQTALKVATKAIQAPWWEEQAGQFKNDPLFDRIVAAGQAYRRAHTPRTRK